MPTEPIWRATASSKTKAIEFFGSGTMTCLATRTACGPSSIALCTSLTPTQPSPIKGEGYRMVALTASES